MENESFERALEPQPTKRKRSSILKPAEKRVSRDLRTVSFNERCIYKELHQDGTCDITNLFLREDMDLTMMDVIEPVVDHHNQTIDSSMDMSMEQASLLSNGDISHNNNNNNYKNIESEVEEEEENDDDCTLTEDKMIDVEKDQTLTSLSAQLYNGTHNDSSQMDLTLISQFLNTMPKVNNIDMPSVNYDASTIYDKKMSLASDMSVISSLNTTLLHTSNTSDSGSSSNSGQKMTEQVNESTFLDATLVAPRRESTTMMNHCLSRMSEISSFNSIPMANITANETFFGAFHDSNNISIQSRASDVDTMVHHIEALNECIEKVDQETQECRQRLDDEIANLFKFYRHTVNKDNKYEFAIKIFGLRHSIWLIIKVDPENYPNEKLSLKFAVNKRDRHLYPFPEYAEAVRRCTKEGKHGYLTKFVINAQKFRRFLRATGYRKPNK